MSVFRLDSDNQFLNAKYNSGICVYEYNDDPNVFDVIHVDHFDCSWSLAAVVDPDDDAAFEALEVFGVTIEGSKLKELVSDLTLVGKQDQEFSLLVNRQGLCFLIVESQPIATLRINDHFGWSKYGVKPAISTIWSIWEMNNGAVLVAPPTNLGDREDDGDNSVQTIKHLKEKEKLMVEKNELMEKRLEEKEKEVVALKAALNALTHED